MSEEDAALQLEKERTARLAAIVSKLKEATEAADPSSLKTNLRMLQDIMVSARTSTCARGNGFYFSVSSTYTFQCMNSMRKANVVPRTF